MMHGTIKIKYIVCIVKLLYDKLVTKTEKKKLLDISTNEPIITDTLARHVKGRASGVREIMPRISEGGERIFVLRVGVASVFCL